MKYSYFEEQMERLGFKVLHNDTHVTVKDCQNTLAKVSKKQRLIFNTDYPYFHELKEEEQKTIARLTYILANTVVKDRIEDKYYYFLKGFDNTEFQYLNQDKITLDYYTSNYFDTPNIKTQFTDEEFDALPDDIKSHNWEKIKVEREEE